MYMHKILFAAKLLKKCKRCERCLQYKQYKQCKQGKQHKQCQLWKQCEQCKSSFCGGPTSIAEGIFVAFGTTEEYRGEMWFLVDVDDQKVNWENSVKRFVRAQLHLLSILFTRNRSESLVVVLKLTFGTRVFQRQQSGCKIISIILMKYFSCWWIWRSISIPLRDPIKRLYSAPSSLKESQVSAPPSAHQHPCLKL